MRHIHIRVHSGARHEKIEDSVDTIKVYTQKPAVDGKANKAVIEILPKHLGIGRNKIFIKSGLKSRNKVVEIFDS